MSDLDIIRQIEKEYNIKFKIVDEPSGFSFEKTIELSVNDNNQVYYLAIRYAKLQKIPSQITNLTNLQSLNVSYNQLSSLPDSLGYLTNLQSLNLWRNQLSELPDFLGNLTNLKSLDVKSNQLSSLPDFLGHLTNLQTLDVTNNQLSSLPDFLGHLTNLQTLVVSYNQLSEIPDSLGNLTNLQELNVGSNQLSEIPDSLGHLTNLQTLVVSYNQLSEIPDSLGNLTNLQELYVGYNQLSDLPDSLGNLTNLQELNVSGNQLSELPDFICKLTNLQTLDVSYNRLRELPDSIGNMESLKYLNIQNNEITDIPPSFINLLKNLQDIEDLLLGKFLVEGNPLSSPPIEVFKNGKQAVIEYYTRMIDKEKSIHNEMKVLLVGEAGVGKTSLLRRLTNKKFYDNSHATIGIQDYKWIVRNEDQPLRINFWDFGGQEIFNSTHQLLFSNHSIYVLVHDARYNNDPEEWLKLIESFGNDISIFLVNNKIDENKSNDLNTIYLRRKYKNIQGFYDISCKTNEGVDILRNRIIAKAMQISNDFVVSDPWHRIKIKLRQMKENYISLETYQSICKEEMITNNQEQNKLREYLNSIGIIKLSQEFSIYDMIILNPNWITSAMNRILYNSNGNNNGIVNLKSLENYILQDYSKHSLETVIHIMNRMELCYNLDDENLLIPNLLSVQEPLQTQKLEVELKFIFKYDFNPKAVLQRFIVKIHHDIKDEIKWRYGVVLDSEVFNCVAKIEMEQWERTINVSISGTNDVEYLSTIIEHVRSINGSYNELSISELIPLPDHPEITVDFQDLVGLSQQGMSSIHIGRLKKSYNIEKLIEGINYRGIIGRKNENENKVNFPVEEIGEKRFYLKQFIEMPDEYKIPFKQYLVYFSEYVKQSKGLDIDFEVQSAEKGLNLLLDYKHKENANLINKYLAEYTDFIQHDIDNFTIFSDGSINQMQADYIILELKNQIRMLKSNLENKQLEKKYLKKQNKVLNEENMVLLEKNYSLVKENKSLISENLVLANENKLLNDFTAFFKYQIQQFHNNFNTQKYPESISFNVNQNQTVSTNVNVDFDLKIEFPQLIDNFEKLSRLIKNIESEYKKELDDIHECLDDLTMDSEKENFKKPMNRIRRFLGSLFDDSTKLNAIITKTENGIEMAQKIGKNYNKIAQWVALPTIPDVFLGG